MEDIETLIQMILANYQLPIEIEHALPDWPLVDYRKKSPSQTLSATLKTESVVFIVNHHFPP